MNDKSQPEGVWVLQPDDPEYPNVVYEWAATCDGYPCRVANYGATRVPPGVRWYVLTRSDGVQHPRLEGRSEDLETAKATAQDIAHALRRLEADLPFARLELEGEMKRVDGRFVGEWWGKRQSKRH